MIGQDFLTVVARNFNYIAGPDDKRGDRPFVQDITYREFGSLFQSNGILDLGFVGPRYT